MEGIVLFKILILFINYSQGTSTSFLYPFGDAENDTRLFGSFDVDVKTSAYASFGVNYTSIDVLYDGRLRIPNFASGTSINVFHAISPLGGAVFYRDASSEESSLQRAQTEVRRINTQSTFTPTSLFIATWDGIPPSTGRLQNTYQAVLVSDGKFSFVLLLYDTIQWTTSSNREAIAGFRGITLPGSGTSEISELSRNSNLVTTGLWILSLDVDTSAFCNPRCINGTCVDVNTCCNGSPTCNRTSTSSLYPFGVAAGDTHLIGFRNTEINTSAYAFFGSIYTSIGVFNFGQLQFPSVRLSVFTARVHSTGTVFYRDASSEEGLLLCAQTEVRRINTQSTFTPTSLFIVTWIGLLPFGGQIQLQNTFQAVLVSNERSSFVLLLYETIQWTISNNREAFAGFGDITLPGSGTSEISELSRNSNLVTPGLWILSLDVETSAICNPGCGNGTCVDVNNTCCNGNPTCDTFCNPSCVNGNCTVINGMAVCDCFTGFIGESCDRRPCDINPCQNDGTCVEMDLLETCTCSAAHTGRFCDINVLDSTCYK